MDLILIVTAMAVRLVSFRPEAGFLSDINCFKAWSMLVFEGGFGNFYASDVFTDYPPGYMYVLYLVGLIRNAFGLQGAAFTALIKLPAVLCDVGCVAFIYNLGLKHQKKQAAFLIALAYALNPAIILNSAVWGQVDAVHTLIMLISLRLLSEKKPLAAYTSYALALLVKPQSLMFAPLYLFSLYDYLIRDKFQKPVLLRACAAALAVLVIGISPFGFGNVTEQYINTLLSYPYASVNAYNLYGLFGANWAHTSGRLLFMSYSQWGTLFVALITLAAFALLYVKKTADKYFLTAAFLSVSAFMFSTRMHERYIFPAVALFSAAYALKRSKAVLFMLVGFSATLFINCRDTLSLYKNGGDLLAENITPISLINVALAVFMTYWMFRDAFGISSPREERGNQAFTRADTKLLSKVYLFAVHFLSVKDVAFRRNAGLNAFSKNRQISITLIATWYDFTAAAIILFCAAVSLAGLGDIHAPKTAWPSENPSSAPSEAIADLGENNSVTQIIWQNGVINNRPFTLSLSDGGEWREAFVFDSGDVFAWRESPAVFNARYVKITAYGAQLRELGFKNGDRLLPLLSDAKLFDEQELIPPAPGYMNSTYFDEIYHARTAYEYKNGIRPYETTHPPLGKVIIAGGISLFGMSPFGFRVMGAVFGVLMLPLIYVFAKRLCGGVFWPCFCTIMLAADFMRFSQTRMATIDVFVTFFIWAMYYFMYRYQTTDFSRPLRELLIPLAFSGLFMGLAVAVKWQGVYAGLGLGVLFFLDLYHRRGADFKTRIMPILGSCMLFFVAMPVVIYLLSYIPYLNAPNMGSIWDNQLSMFDYHSRLNESHSFESPWWQWPLDIRPVFLYLSESGNMRSAISTMGNPVVWYAGLIAVIYSLLNKRDRNGSFLLIAFAAQLLPWIPITRCTFIYHYFPCVGFMLLLLAYTLRRRGVAIALSAAAILLFAVYYPVLSGMQASPEYVRKYLEWLPTWNII